MRALVTGSTGKVGNAVAQALPARGDQVRAVVRNPAAAVLPDDVEIVRGDVTDPASLGAAVESPPLLPAGQASFFRWNAEPDATKAREHLGWKSTPLDLGIAATIEAMEVRGA